MATDRWKPGRKGGPLHRIAVRVANRVASALASRSRKSHRGHKGAPGGKLVSAIRSRSFVKVNRWGLVLPFHSLGNKFMWLTRGTKKQPKLDARLTPERSEVEAAVQADALRHFAAREARANRSRGAR